MRLPYCTGRAARAATAALALALSPVAAVSARDEYSRTEPPKTRFRAGPLRFTPRLELRNAGRDSNATLDPTEPFADTSVVVRGAVDGYVPVGRRVRLSGDGWLDWSYFRRLTTERSTDPGAFGRAEVDFGPFTFIGGGGGLQARQLYSIDIDQRILRQERWVNGGAEWRLTRRFVVSGGAEHRTYRFDPSARTASSYLTASPSLDRNSLVGRAALRFKLTSMTTAVAVGELLQDEFRLSFPGLDTTRSYRYLGGLEFGEKALITGRFLVGMRDFPAASSGSLPTYRGPALTAELAMPLFNRLRLVGTGQRDVYISSTAVRTAEERARNAYVLTQLQVAGIVDLPLQFEGRANVGYTQASYLLPAQISGVPFPRVDHLYSAGGSLMRRFSDSVRIGGTVTYHRRVSTIPSNSYDRWVYGVSAEIVP